MTENREPDQEAPATPAAATPVAPLGPRVVASRNWSGSGSSGIATLVMSVAAILLLLVGGQWLVNKVLTRTSAEIGRCYDTAKVIVGDFDEIECGGFEGMKLFDVGGVDELQASSTCPNHQLTLIVERPDQAYCFAPVHLRIPVTAAPTDKHPADLD